MVAGMSGLPLSIRVATWVVDAWMHGRDLADAVGGAHSGTVSDLAGELEGTLTQWRRAGERLLLVALPRPGALQGMPAISPVARGAALEAGECVIAPTVGGLLVPVISSFGPAGDEGRLVSWTAYEAAPVARHTVEALDARELTRDLSEAVRAATEELESAGGLPWHPREATPQPSPPGRALPQGMPSRELMLLDRACAVLDLAEAGLAAELHQPALDAGTSQRRQLALRNLAARAAQALAGAANVSAAVQARSSTER